MNEIDYLRRLNDVEFTYVVENEIICNDTYCPFFKQHMSSPSCPNCEGRYCEEAFREYCDQNPEELIIS